MTVISMNKINKRIPGILPPPPKNEIDGKITNLSSKSIPELVELRDRQVKLLNNRPFITKLDDKGAKIQAFYDKIVNELRVKQEEEKTCEMLTKLNLNSPAVHDIEWEGKLDNKSNTYLDSDDDSDPEDLLEILSKNTSHEKRVKVLEPEKLLVTADDLLNIGEIPHVKYLVEKTEVQVKANVTEKFKPYKTTKSNVHNPEKEILRKKHKYWEVTAATPPPSVHGAAKILNIEESLKLQKDYNIHLKEVEAQHAAQKLLARVEVKMAELPVDTTKFGSYRERQSDISDDSDPEGSDKEVYDEEPERGGVIFTVMN